MVISCVSHIVVLGANKLLLFAYATSSDIAVTCKYEHYLKSKYNSSSSNRLLKCLKTIITEIVALLSKPGEFWEWNKMRFAIMLGAVVTNVKCSSIIIVSLPFFSPHLPAFFTLAWKLQLQMPQLHGSHPSDSNHLATSRLGCCCTLYWIKYSNVADQGNRTLILENVSPLIQQMQPKIQSPS